MAAPPLPRLDARHLVWDGGTGPMLSFTRADYVWINAETGALKIGAPTGALRDPAPAEEAAARQLLDRVTAAG